LAALDYAFQRYRIEKQMRMTKQEAKEEFKLREGDPLIKARIKQVQRRMASRRDHRRPRARRVRGRSGVARWRGGHRHDHVGARRRGPPPYCRADHRERRFVATGRRGQSESVLQGARSRTARSGRSVEADRAAPGYQQRHRVRHDAGRPLHLSRVIARRPPAPTADRANESRKKRRERDCASGSGNERPQFHRRQIVAEGWLIVSPS